MEKLPDFQYHRPSSLKEAVALLNQFGDNCKVIAGGTDLLIQMKHQLLSPSHVVALKWIPGLDEITEEKRPGMLYIGALATHARLKAHPTIKARFSILVDALNRLGTPQVRNIATIGGNLCNAAPSADTAPPLLALEARLTFVSRQGEREMGLEGFFLSPGKTQIEPGEILASISLPMPPSYSCGAYIKHTRREALDLPIIGVAVQCLFTHDLRRFEQVRIGLGVAAPTPIRAKAAEAFLKGKPVQNEIVEEAGRIVSLEAKPRDTWRGSASYRLDMIRALIKEAILVARERATQFQE